MLPGRMKSTTQFWFLGLLTKCSNKTVSWSAIWEATEFLPSEYSLRNDRKHGLLRRGWLTEMKAGMCREEGRQKKPFPSPYWCHLNLSIYLIPVH